MKTCQLCHGKGFSTHIEAPTGYDDWTGKKYDPGYEVKVKPCKCQKNKKTHNK